MTLPAMALETKGNSELNQYGVDQTASSQQAGGNMEGKDGPLRARRVGPVDGLDHRHLQRVGQLDARQSATPLGGGVAMTNMMLGEVSRVAYLVWASTAS